ncbi:MAG TPA: hypothetical protein VGC92_05105, partial [Phenylobacterium sp.]
MFRFPRLRRAGEAAAPRQVRRRRIAAAVLLGLLVGLVAALPPSRAFDRRGIDFLLPLRHRLFGPLFAPGQS